MTYNRRWRLLGRWRAYLVLTCFFCLSVMSLCLNKIELNHAFGPRSGSNMHFVERKTNIQVTQQGWWVEYRNNWRWNLVSMVRLYNNSVPNVIKYNKSRSLERRILYFCLFVKNSLHATDSYRLFDFEFLDEHVFVTSQREWCTQWFFILILPRERYLKNYQVQIR